MLLAEFPSVAPEYAVGWPFDVLELSVRIAKVNAMGEPSAPRSGKYAAYLSSPSWRRKRMLVLALANCVCFHCKGRATEVHHKTYERVGYELLTDLEPVCDRCHAAEHGTIRVGTTQSVRDCILDTLLELEEEHFKRIAEGNA